MSSAGRDANVLIMNSLQLHLPTLSFHKDL